MAGEPGGDEIETSKRNRTPRSRGFTQKFEQMHFCCILILRTFNDDTSGDSLSAPLGRELGRNVPLDTVGHLDIDPRLILQEI